MTGATQASTLADYWLEHVEEWQRSGQSQLAYCEARQLAYHRFVYWRQKFQGQCGKAHPKPASALVPVTYRSSDVSQELSLSLPNGMTLRGISVDNVTLVSQLLEQLR